MDKWIYLLFIRCNSTRYDRFIEDHPQVCQQQTISINHQLQHIFCSYLSLSSKILFENSCKISTTNENKYVYNDQRFITITTKSRQSKVQRKCFNSIECSRNMPRKITPNVSKWHNTTISRHQRYIISWESNPDTYI